MTPEGSLKKSIEELLAIKRIPVFRMNAGDRFGSHNGKKWRIKGHEPGTWDLLASPKLWIGGGCFPVFLWIECKIRPNKLTKIQEDFGNRMLSEGHKCLVAYQLDDVAGWLKEIGL